MQEDSLWKIRFGSRFGPEHDLLENSTVGVFPDLNLEAWESCQFNPDFPELDRLKETSRIMENSFPTFRS